MNYTSPNIKNRMKNLSQNLNEIRSNLAYNTQPNKFIGTDSNFNAHNSQEMFLIKDELFNLKVAFKKMVDLVLEEIDDIKNDMLTQTSELQKQDDHNLTLLLHKIEVIDLKQNQKDLRCDELVAQSEHMSDTLQRRFEVLEEFTNSNIENFKKIAIDKDQELHNTIILQNQQLLVLTKQNTAIEEFMGITVASIKSHQQKISEFGSICYNVDMNSKLLENEMKEFLGEIDKKFELYKESTSGDL